MSTGAAKMSVYVGEKFACVRISGRANFASSVDFKTLITDLRQKGYSYFVLDLTECGLMDSTFLGLLAGFGIKLNTSQKDSCAPAIELVNTNPRIMELLESLGVSHLFRFANGPLGSVPAGEPCTQAPSSPSKEEVTRACLEAHQTLMQLNPQNAARFKDVAAFLAENLNKPKPSSA